jgi:hypothetical protein
MTNASAWFALAGALGGVALTGAASLRIAALTHRWGEQARSRADREQELRAVRDQLRGASHDYLVATNQFYQAVHQMYLKALDNKKFHPWEDVREAYTALQDGYTYLTISAGAEVRKPARAYNVALYALADATRASDEDTLSKLEEAWSKLEPESREARERVRAAMRAALDVSD